MAIRKPSVSVNEARLLAESRRAGLKAYETGGEAVPGAGPEKDDHAKAPEKEDRAEAMARAPLEPLEPLAVRREPKVQVFLSAPLPGAGVSMSFDLLSRTHVPAKALQMILRRALDLYEARIDDGSFVDAARDYALDEAAGCELVQTSRMMPKRLVTIARAHFDPLGFESNRAFGRMLASAALAVFFAAERNARR